MRLKTKTMRMILIVALLAITVASYAIYQSQYRQINRAKEAVEAKLIDGESARFRKVREVDSFTVCGEVNSKNRYGAYSGFSAFEVVVMPATGMSILDEPRVSIEGADDYYPITCKSSAH